MRKIMLKLNRFKKPILIFSILFLFCLFMQQSPFLTVPNKIESGNNSIPFQTSVTYDGFFPVIIENQTITDNILIKNYANVTLVNTTVYGTIILTTLGVLHLLQNSTVTRDIIISDYAKLLIDNSTVVGTIYCWESTLLEISESQTNSTAVWKSDSANITITNSSIGLLTEYGEGGQIQVFNSQIASAELNGISRVYFNNTNVTSFDDAGRPMSIITGPMTFNIFTLSYNFSTSERSINLTWMGWDSPIIDGYMNVSFQILLDGQFYAEVNGSGFFDSFFGNIMVNMTEPGFHNISVISFDSTGNNSTITITLEVIEYASFPWLPFWITIAIVVGIIAILVLFIRLQQQKGYHSSLGTIFKKELSDSKTKIIIFVALAAAPGIIIALIFGSAVQRVGYISIDTIRGMVSMIFSLFLYYFGLAFSIIFAVGGGSIVKAKRDGTLSWFLSKPVRRWEFLWGKILAYLIIIIIAVLAASASFMLGGMAFIDPLYTQDLISMGGYIFLIGLAALIPLIAIVVLCSTLFNKIGLAIFIPIMILMVIPPLVSFLPLFTRHEWPLLLSFSYYYEQLGSHWVSSGGGLFGTIGSSYSLLLGFEITPLNLTPTHIILILSTITITSFVLSTIFIQRKNII